MKSTSKALITNNIKYSAIARVVAFIVGFAILPYVMSHTSKELYGSYELVLTFTGYLNNLDLGVTPAVIKFVAQFVGTKDQKNLDKIISAAITLYVIVGIVSGIGLLVMSFFFHRIFDVDPANITAVKQLLWIAAGSSLLVWPARTFDGILQGIQRYDWRAAIEIVAAILIALSAYLIFSLGGNIVHFLLANYLVMLFKYVSSYIIGNARYLKAKIIFPYFNKDIFKQIFSFSSFILFSNIFGIIIFQIDNLVTGIFVSVASVAIYSVSYKLQDALRTVNSLIGAPLLPATAMLEGAKDYARQTMLLIKGTKYVTLLFGPMVVIVVFFAPVLITSWMGPDLGQSIHPAQILTSFWLFNSVTEVGSGMLTAKGYVKYKFMVTVLNAVVNLTFSLILVQKMGIAGIALGTVIGMVVVQTPLLLRKYLKTMNISFWQYFDKTIKRNLLVYLCAAGLSYLVLTYTNLQSLVFVLAAMAVVYVATIAFGFFASLSSEQRQELVSMAKSFKK